MDRKYRKAQEVTEIDVIKIDNPRRRRILGKKPTSIRERSHSPSRVIYSCEVQVKNLR